jgi:hypothetical protein
MTARPPLTQRLRALLAETVPYLRSHPNPVARDLLDRIVAELDVSGDRRRGGQRAYLPAGPVRDQWRSQVVDHVRRGFTPGQIARTLRIDGQQVSRGTVNHLIAEAREAGDLATTPAVTSDGN